MGRCWEKRAEAGKDLKSKFEQCKEAKGIIKDYTVLRGYTPGGWGGQCDVVTKYIYILDCNDDCQALMTLAHEAYNSTRAADFKKCQSDADFVNQAGKEAYVKCWEKIEYENLVKAQELIDKCKTSWGCDKVANKYDYIKKAKSFDDYYKNYLADSHKKYYRDIWDTNHENALKRVKQGSGGRREGEDALLERISETPHRWPFKTELPLCHCAAFWLCCA